MAKKKSHLGIPKDKQGRPYLSYCCNSEVHYNSHLGLTPNGSVMEVKEEGYHCSKCRGAVTIYGNEVK